MGIMPMFDKGAILNPVAAFQKQLEFCLLYTSPSPRD